MTASSTHKTGILGGTFDPVHNGHLGLARQAGEMFALDRLLFIPANQSPHKKGHPLTPAVHRLAMLEIALKDFPKFSVSDIEIKRGGASFSIDTLDTLKEKHPEEEFHLILGVDAFQHIADWRDSSRLLENVHILVGSRPGYNMETGDLLKNSLAEASRNYSREESDEGTINFLHEKCGRRISFFQITPQAVSATEIRKEIYNNPKIKKMLPPLVERYIMQHQLYK